MAKQHRVVVVVEAAQALEHRSQTRHTTQLAGFDRFKDVQHLFSRDAHQLVVTGIKRRGIARVDAVHVIRHALVRRVKLNPGADAVAVFARLKFVMGHKLRGKYLELQRYRQILSLCAWPQTHKALTGGFDGACDQRLLAVEVGQAIGV